MEAKSRGHSEWTAERSFRWTMRKGVNARSKEYPRTGVVPRIAFEERQHHVEAARSTSLSSIG